MNSQPCSVGCHVQSVGNQALDNLCYHPQSNGMVERFHRQLKYSLRSCLTMVDWPSHLPWILLGLRSAPKEDHKVSAAEVLYGVPLALSGELLANEEPPAANFLEQLRRPLFHSLPTRPLNSPAPDSGPPEKLATTQFVFVTRGAPGPPLSSLYDSPYREMARVPKAFLLELDGPQDSISMNRLNSCLASEIKPEDPPRSGRPPATFS